MAMNRMSRPLRYLPRVFAEYQAYANRSSPGRVLHELAGPEALEELLPAKRLRPVSGRLGNVHRAGLGRGLGAAKAALACSRPIDLVVGTGRNTAGMVRCANAAQFATHLEQCLAAPSDTGALGVFFHLPAWKAGALGALLGGLVGCALASCRGLAGVGPKARRRVELVRDAASVSAALGVRLGRMGASPGLMALGVLRVLTGLVKLLAAGLAFGVGYAIGVGTAAIAGGITWRPTRSVPAATPCLAPA